MHYVANRSHRMQKYNFGETYRDTLFVEFVSVRVLTFHSQEQIPPDAKHKFNVTCPGVLFVEFESVPSEHEK
jgi:hypothetical protein